MPHGSFINGMIKPKLNCFGTNECSSIRLKIDCKVCRRIRGALWKCSGVSPSESAHLPFFMQQTASMFGMTHSHKRTSERRHKPDTVFQISHLAHSLFLDYLVSNFLRMVQMKTRAKQKVWIAIFTCFQTRSVHSESVFSLDTSSVINPIIRFNASRPGLTRMYSDRGTNF